MADEYQKKLAAAYGVDYWISPFPPAPRPKTIVMASVKRVGDNVEIDPISCCDISRCTKGVNHSISCMAPGITPDMRITLDELLALKWQDGCSAGVALQKDIEDKRSKELTTPKKEPLPIHRAVIANKDGYLIVDVGGGAQMTCPTGELEWRLRYGDAPALVAASVVESFEYLIMHCNKAEAWRRIKIMRVAMIRTDNDK